MQETNAILHLFIGFKEKELKAKSSTILHGEPFQFKNHAECERVKYV